MMKKSIKWIEQNWDIPLWKVYWLYRDIRGWLYHNFKVKHFLLVREAWNSYPFDYAYLFYVMKAKMEEMRIYFIKSGMTGPQVPKEIELACKLQDIFLEEELEVKEYVNLKNWKRYMRHEFMRHEFQDEETALEFFKKFPGVLRARKAYHLYFMVLEYKSGGWWD